MNILLTGQPSCRLTPWGQPQKDEGGALIYYYLGNDGREYGKTVYATAIEEWHQYVPLCNDQESGKPAKCCLR
jgi:hypothetical protein